MAAARLQLVHLCNSFVLPWRLLTNGVKDFMHVFVRRVVILSTPYELNHYDPIRLVLCDWLVKILSLSPFKAIFLG